MRHKIKVLGTNALLCVAAFIAACGGGGNGGSSTPSTPALPAPSGLSYSVAPALIVDQAMTPLTPTVTGSVTSYTVTPALPAGLTLNSQTGVISGVPAAAAPTVAHMVTASNSSGSTTASVSLTVNDIAPSIDYGSQPLRFVTGAPVTPVTPAISGGAPVTWSIDPQLPAGLTFDPHSGRIAGTPAVLAAAQGYVVTATNSGGQSQATLPISVESGVLFDLGHASEIKFLRLTATRALSQDVRGHWALWDLATAELLAQGDSPCALGSRLCLDGPLTVDLAGATVVIQTQTGFDVRAASDGQSIASIASDVSSGEISSWKLATDGNYVTAATVTGLRAWTPVGALLFARSGNYSHAIPFAAPHEIRVARSPAGDGVIQTIAVPSGAATVSGTFVGDFHSWFLDGERFLANVGTTVSVYSKAAAQEDIVALPTISSLAGQGGWFWINHNDNVKVFAVGASASPAATYTYGTFTRAIGSGTQLAVMEPSSARLRVVDLSTATPSSVEYDVPRGEPRIFGANQNGHWLIGSVFGVLFDGSTLPGPVKYFGYGAALSVAGSETRAVIATASGRIVSFDAATRLLESTIDFDASHIELTSDGAVLAAAANDRYAQFQPDRTINIYAMPQGTLLYARPYTFGSGPFPVSMSLARSGGFIAELLFDEATRDLTWRVTPIAGGPPTFLLSGSGIPVEAGVFRLSPDGRRIAISDQTLDADPDVSTTNIYKDGSLTGAAAGYAVGWLDSERLLVNKYNVSDAYAGAAIRDGTGALISSPPLPHVPVMQALTPDTIYSARQNAILSLTTGAALWTGSRPADSDLGAVAGPWVVFASGTTVRAEPH